MKIGWKIGALIGLVAIISLVVIGVAYADSGSITTNFQSQSLCKFSWVEPNDNGSTSNHDGYNPVDSGDNGQDPLTAQAPGVICVRAPGNYASTSASINNTANTITFNLSNAYPGYHPTVFFGLLNQNSTPGVVSAMTFSSITPNIPSDVSSYIKMTLNGITKNQTITAGKEVVGALDIAVDISAPDSLMGKIYTISVTIVVTQSSQPSQNKTNTCLISTPNPSTFGQPVKFTANVTGSGGTPAGTVTFYEGTKNIGAPLLVNGTATLNYSGLSVGSHSITANYGGDTKYNGSTSNVVTQVVNAIKTTTATSLLSSVNPSVFGQPITFTASVYPKTATGSVTFYIGKNSIGSSKLLGGSASISVSTLIVGSHNITAVYSGDSNFASSTSNVLEQKVRSKTITYWPSKPNPCSYGKICIFTAQIEIQSPGIGIPTGTVMFCDGAKTLGTVSLSTGGQAKFSISSLSRGTHTIMAVYGGDDNCNTSSNTFSQVIN